VFALMQCKQKVDVSIFKPCQNGTIKKIVKKYSLPS